MPQVFINNLVDDAQIGKLSGTGLGLLFGI